MKWEESCRNFNLLILAEFWTLFVYFACQSCNASFDTNFNRKLSECCLFLFPRKWFTHERLPFLSAVFLDVQTEHVTLASPSSDLLHLLYQALGMRCFLKLMRSVAKLRICSHWMVSVRLYLLKKCYSSALVHLPTLFLFTLAGGHCWCMWYFYSKMEKISVLCEESVDDLKVFRVTSLSICCFVCYSSGATVTKYS
jgi:hypothetical protein